MRSREKYAVRGVRIEDEGIHIAHADQLTKNQDSRAYHDPKQHASATGTSTPRNILTVTKSAPHFIYAKPCGFQSNKPPMRMPLKSPHPQPSASPSPSPPIPYHTSPSSSQTAPSRLLHHTTRLPRSQPSSHTAPPSSLHPLRRLLARAARVDKGMQRCSRT
jgi:hypothetical protein